MAVKDGLLVRLRPHKARLTAEQIYGVCELAARFGNGLVEVTNRGNFQIRGVETHTHQKLLEGVAELGLLDQDLEAETKRSLQITP